MSIARSFDEFMEEPIDNGKPIIRFAAGVAIVIDEHILLVHPTNSSWQKNTLGIPKGRIEGAEDPLHAAIREVKEEVGIDIDPYKLEPDAHVSPKYDSDGNVVSHLIYFILRISDLSEIGLTSDRVPKDQLQLEEVDWAGFVKIIDAYPKMNTYQRIILDKFL